MGDLASPRPMRRTGCSPDRRLPILAKPFSASALVAAAREMPLRAREVQMWAEQKRSRARQLSLIGATCRSAAQARLSESISSLLLRKCGASSTTSCGSRPSGLFCLRQLIAQPSPESP